jgi:hypothetical protein
MVKSVELLQLRGLVLIRHLKNLQQSVTRGLRNQLRKLAGGV